MHAHHNHSHDDHGHHHHHVTSFNTAFAVAVTVTLLYTIMEACYGFKANSMSLLADAAHNLGDTLGLALSWLANWLLSLPARKRYSYGFKRTTIVAALINAFILVATSALIAFEAIQKFFHPSAIDEKVVIIVAVLGIVINAGCSLLFMRGAATDLNIRSSFWHLMADAIILVGVVVTTVLIAYTDWHWIDPVVSLLIVGIVLFGTWGLLRDSLHLILDAIPHYIDQVGVKHYLRNLPGVEAVHDLHIWGLSTREVALTAHLVMPENHLTNADYRLINDKLLKDFRINHVTLQVETTSHDDPCDRIHNC